MKIAIPVANGKLNMHFGHCEGFDLFEVDTKTKTLGEKSYIQAPPHEPGLLPRFLNEQGVSDIIAGGMGARAQELFVENGIKVLVGAPCEESAKLAQDYLDGKLCPGTNVCDH
jgi:predicted Fe-Mo cluster-binding NifX family protein